MTELDKYKYKILRYFNEHHVRHNENISEETVRSYFSDIKGTTYYNTAFEELAANKFIDQTSSNRQWKIQPSGEFELNILQQTIDLEKNIEATKKLTESSKTILDITKIVGVLGIFGLAFQIYLAMQQNEYMNRQNSIMQKQYTLDSLSRVESKFDPQKELKVDSIKTIADTLHKESVNKITRHE